MYVCIGKLKMLDNSCCIQHMGEWKIELKLTIVEVMITRCYLFAYLFGGDL